MEINTKYIISDDVVIYKATDLPNNLINMIDYKVGDYIITRRNSRKPAAIIDKYANDLIGYFRKPITIIDAVLEYSSINSLNPKGVMDDIYGLIRNLIISKVFISESDNIKNTIISGQYIHQYAVVQVIQSVEDSEVLLVKNKMHKFFILKITNKNPDPKTIIKFQREIDILSELDGKFNCAIVESGIFDERVYLVIERYEGISIKKYSDEIRHNRYKLTQLCKLVIEAYSHLHKQGIIHGDIHPENILVNRLGNIHIIDYGLARKIDNQAIGFYRGGVPFYYDPDLARMLLANKPYQFQSPADEQYQVAVLLFYIVTGQHYLDFSIEKEKMLNQILFDQPKSFQSIGINDFGNIENILRIALQKDKTKRFQSFNHMLITFNENIHQIDSETIEDANVIVDTKKILGNIDIYSTIDGSWLKNPFQSPNATINYGAAGVAYYWYQRALQEENSLFLALADIWINRAKTYLSDESGLFNHDLGLTSDSIGYNSLYNGLSGIYVMQSLISHAMGDFVSMEESIDDFIRCGSEHINFDLTLGQSGILLGCALLYRVLKLNDSTCIDRLRNFGSQNASTLTAWIETQPSILDKNNDLKYLGIAHGWAGILYAIGGWCVITNAPIPTFFQHRLDELRLCAEPIGRGIQWNQKTTTNLKSFHRASWCNGTSGYLYLWTLASRLIPEKAEEYQTIAEQSAWNVWEDAHEFGDLCCGFAGRAYSLLHYYKYTQNKDWLLRSRILTQKAIDLMYESNYNASIINHSLYKGILGISLLVNELNNPSTSKMPLFEI